MFWTAWHSDILSRMRSYRQARHVFWHILACASGTNHIKSMWSEMSCDKWQSCVPTFVLICLLTCVLSLVLTFVLASLLTCVLALLRHLPYCCYLLWYSHICSEMYSDIKSDACSAINQVWHVFWAKSPRCTTLQPTPAKLQQSKRREGRQDGRRWVGDLKFRDPRLPGGENQTLCNAWPWLHCTLSLEWSHPHYWGWQRL